MVGASVALSFVKERMPTVEKWVDGVPSIIIEDGRVHRERMLAARVDEADVLEAARELQGLERMEQIKYAILERSGRITIVPKREAG